MPGEETQQRLAIAEYKLDEHDSRLKAGAATFGKFRSLIVGCVLAAVGSLGGIVWTAATRAAEAQATREQVAETRQILSAIREETKALTLQVSVLDTLLRTERDQREDLERMVRDLSNRKPR